MAKDHAGSFNRTERRPHVARTLHRGIEKKRATEPRRSARLKRDIDDCKKGSVDNDLFPYPTDPDREHPTSAPQVIGRKRKRQHEHDGPLHPPLDGKRPGSVNTPTVERGSGLKVAVSPSNEISPIDYWSKNGRWPKEYFQQDEQTRKYLTRDLDAESWFEKYWVPNMKHLLARKKSSSSLRGSQSVPGPSEPTSTTPSDQMSRAEKSASYKDPRYEPLLKTKGVFLSEYNEGVTEELKSLCHLLLETEADVPEDSLFRDDLFKATCEEIQNRNEAKVTQDIGRLIVPSARHLAIRGAKELERLVESVNEGWDNSIPLTKPRPQSDYAVGFRREAFTDEQLNRLQSFVGDLTDTSYFMATFYMYFPFLTCEIKCGAAALNIADRQNAHSMTLAVRAVVEMFRIVQREKELNREILAFSISHDDRRVRIYGHYPVIEGLKTTFYRHPIHEYNFTILDGKDKWTAYKFTRNVYDLWMPNHFTRLCSVINQLPAELSFELSHQSELEFQDSGLSQEFQSYALSQSNADSMSLPRRDSPASALESQDATSTTSMSQPPGPFKKPRKRPAAGH